MHRRILCDRSGPGSIFAEATGDSQWIHNDAARAQTGQFGAFQTGRRFTVEIEGGRKPACVTEAVSLFYRA
jgi:acyl dehydratase